MIKKVGNMSKKTNINPPKGDGSSSKRAFLIFTSVFLGIILLAGIIIGTVAIVRNARAVMKYKGIYLNEGVANYISATYKYDFIKSLKRLGIECYDDETFWQSEAEDGVTYASLLEENTERHLKRVIIGAYLFDRNAKLTKDDKDTIKRSVSEVLDYKAGGDKERFNEMGKEAGFTFRDFEKAAELLYKYEMAETVIFGLEGTALEYGDFSEECDEFFSQNYSHVKLMFIRTDGRVVTDSETGKEEVVEYTDAERAEVEARIEEIRTLIANGWMDEGTFDDFVNIEFNTGTVNDTEGYYFSALSSYTHEFADGAPEVVKTALKMKTGEYMEEPYEFGVCFIYKCELEEGAYSRIGIAHFFGDFYSNAASYIYSKSVDAFLSDVVVKDKYNKAAIVTKPYNYELYVIFG